MSQLYKAPITSDQNEISKWFAALTEADKLMVIRDIVTVSAELHSVLLNAIIPNMKLTKGEAEIRDAIATRFLKVINEVGLESLSRNAQALFENPDMDAMPDEEKPS